MSAQWCIVCRGEPKSDEDMQYCVNSEGGYGLPEAWVCHDCMKAAPNGSVIAKKRDELYADDFA